MRNQRGITLVEVSVILGAIVLLATFLAPAIIDYINDAKAVMVKADMETVGVVTVRLVTDLGLSCLKKETKASCLGSNRADILFSEGLDVSTQEVVSKDFIYYEVDWK